MSKIGVKQLNELELCGILSKFSFEFIFLEMVEDVRIEKYVFKSEKKAFILKDNFESPIIDWDRATAFSIDHELSWEKKGENRFNAVLITDEDKNFPDGWGGKDISYFDVREYDVFLWGGYNNGANCWIEERIPRFLHYPINHNTSLSPKLRVKEYYHLYWDDERVKEEIFYRFMSLY